MEKIIAYIVVSGILLLGFVLTVILIIFKHAIGHKEINDETITSCFWGTIIAAFLSACILF
jgi:tellurite resistance protein TehA-like permease